MEGLIFGILRYFTEVNSRVKEKRRIWRKWKCQTEKNEKDTFNCYVVIQKFK